MDMRSFALAAACTTALGAAQTFQAEITPNLDNTIYDSQPPTDGTTTMHLSNGVGTRCFAGRDNNGGLKRALMRFDVAGAIPPGSVITDAELVLSLQQTQTGGPLTLHALTADWGEGRSFAPGGQGGGTQSQAGDASWYERFFGVNPALPWSTLGGEYVAAPSAMITVPTPLPPFPPAQVVVPSTFVTAADVQAWLDFPTSNFGWILIGDETRNATALAFATREDTANAPRLRVTYTPAPNAAATTEFGTGCDPFFVKPRLSAVGRPIIGTTFSITSAPGGSGAPIATLGVSLAAASPTVPVNAFVNAGQDCQFLIDLGQTIFFGGAPSSLVLPLPGSTGVGLDLFWQGFGIEPASQSVVVTNGLLTRTGMF